MLVRALTLALLALPALGMAQMDGSEYVGASVTAVSTEIQPGKLFIVGVKLKLAEGWHVYWRNPGDAGQAPSLKWKLPEGFKVTRTYWPAPHRIVVGGITSYGYEGEATLLCQIATPANYKPGNKSDFSLDIDFLVCKELCLPGSTSVTGDLAKITEREDPVAMRKAMPTLAPTENLTMVQKGKDLTFTFEVQNIDPNTVKSAYFFSAQAPVIDHGADQKWHVEGSKFIIETKASDYAQGQIKKPEGVLVIVLNDRTVAIDYYNAN